MVAGGLDEILPGARERLTGEPGGELGAGDDGVLGHAHRHSADERPGRIGGDVGGALGDRLDPTPPLGPRRVLGLQHALDLVLEFLVDPGIVLRAARGRAGELVLGLGHGASWCVGPDRCRAIGWVLVMDRWRGTHFSCSAPGRCTAVRPLFSLRTSYCGSSSLARTVRPEASVSEVIFRSTAPPAVPPWLFQVTWSPVENSSADACAMAAPPVVDRAAPALPAGALAHTSVPAGPGSPDRGQAHSSTPCRNPVRHVAWAPTGTCSASMLVRAFLRLPSVTLAPVLDRRPGRLHSPGVGRVGPYLGCRGDRSRPSSGGRAHRRRSHTGDAVGAPRV